MLELRTRLDDAVARLAATLELAKLEKIVLAESCTAGLVAASLAQTPGMSRFLCGSAVTYRESVKMSWLGVDPETLGKHTAVSAIVTKQMAEGALQGVAEATVSAAVTGHFGPGAPDELDGIVFVAISRRAEPQVEPGCHRFVLASVDRKSRQLEATCLVIESLADHLADPVAA